MQIGLVANIYNHTSSEIPLWKGQYSVLPFLCFSFTNSSNFPHKHHILKTQISPMPHWHTRKKEQSQKLMIEQFLKFMLIKNSFH